ncbi:MAG: hypothetical protein K1X74_17015 [Pirellulales bacterium]|nr:hypothetical protein [Pirellulales bacterium]
MLALFVVLLLVIVALIAGERLWSRGQRLATLDRAAWAGVPLLAVIALASMGVFVHSTPWWDFNGARLAPTISMFYGYQPYNLPDDGPVLCPHYPPLAILVFLPAALSGNPTVEILIASVCSGLVFFAPLVLLARLVPAPWTPERRLLFAVACLCLAYYTIWQVALRSVSFNIAPDGAAIGFGVAATVAFTIARQTGRRRWLVATALLAAMAVWTKQTLVVVPAVLPLWGFAVLPRREAWLLAALTCGFCCVLLAVFSLAFGFDRMFFNVITIMRESQWIDVHALYRDYWYPWRFFWWMSLPLIAGIVVQRFVTRSSTASPSSPRKLGARVATWWLDDPAALFLLLGLILVPMCLLGRLKIGGDDHHYAPTLVFFAYFALVSTIAGDAGHRALEPDLEKRLLRFATGLCLVLGAWNAVYAARGVWQAPSVFDNPQENAYRTLLARPQTYYFPWHPLAALLAEGKLYHFSYGLMDRRISGHPITQEHFDRYCPRRFKAIAIVPQRAQDSPGAQDWQNYLPQFRYEDRAYGMAGWMTVTAH